MEQGYTPSQCLDFDFALVDFWEWYKAKSEEQKQKRLTGKDKLKDGYTWVHKYQSVDEILRLYHNEHAGGGPIFKDPVVAAMSEQDVRALVDDIIESGEYFKLDDTVGDLPQ